MYIPKPATRTLEENDRRSHPANSAKVNLAIRLEDLVFLRHLTNLDRLRGIVRYCQALFRIEEVF